DRALRADRTAAVDVGLVAVRDAILAVRGQALLVRARAAGAVAVVDAVLAVDASRALGAAAVDVRLLPVADRVRAVSIERRLARGTVRRTVGVDAAFRSEGVRWRSVHTEVACARAVRAAPARDEEPHHDHTREKEGPSRACAHGSS